jgi:hypothetical protein
LGKDLILRALPQRKKSDTSNADSLYLPQVLLVFTVITMNQDSLLDMVVIVRFEVLVVKVSMFWAVMLCGLIGRYEH